VAELNLRSVALAREAIANLAADRPVWVAGSISTFVPWGDNRHRPPAAAERASYREQAELLAEAGADLLALEMIRDIDQACMEQWKGPVACYPECGEWENPDWRFGELAPDDFAAAAESWADRGVRIIGGCCGIGPEHIGALSQRLGGGKQ
jgi:methionine synthase I (cobalamin-dependent)